MECELTKFLNEKVATFNSTYYVEKIVGDEGRFKLCSSNDEIFIKDFQTIAVLLSIIIVLDKQEVVLIIDEDNIHYRRYKNLQYLLE